MAQRKMIQDPSLRLNANPNDTLLPSVDRLLNVSGTIISLIMHYAYIHAHFLQYVKYAHVLSHLRASKCDSDFLS